MLKAGGVRAWRQTHARAFCLSRMLFYRESQQAIPGENRVLEGDEDNFWKNPLLVRHVLRLFSHKEYGRADPFQVEAVNYYTGLLQHLCRSLVSYKVGGWIRSKFYHEDDLDWLTVKNISVV
jgi:hypothetical protein